jgi:DNA-3-methyladenine glycosylase II
MAHYKDSLPYLSKDKKLGTFIKNFGPLWFRRKHTQNPFQALCESIIYQQLSGKAAGTILKRFVALFNPPTSLKLRRTSKFPTPEQVLKIKTEKLRAAGLSGQKASYLKDLAAKFKDGTINPKLFNKMSDQEIIEHVVAVKGIGEWTAHMFLMFTLHRPDVLPVGDLGIQKGFQKLFRLRAKPSPAQMEKLAKNWAGHRTLACMYLWRLVDNEATDW